MKIIKAEDAKKVSEENTYNVNSKDEYLDSVFEKINDESLKGYYCVSGIKLEDRQAELLQKLGYTVWFSMLGGHIITWGDKED